MIILNMSVHDGKSLMYTEKRIDPNTEYCGTPVLISSVSDVEPLKSTRDSYEIDSFVESFSYSVDNIVTQFTKKYTMY